MNLNQAFFNLAIHDQRRRNRIRHADARHHHAEQQLIAALWRWR
jgi:hypothetical protein